MGKEKEGKYPVSARIPESQKERIDEVAAHTGKKRSVLLAELIADFCGTKAIKDYSSKIRFDFDSPDDKTEMKIRRDVVVALTQLSESFDRVQKALSYRIAEQLVDKRFFDLQEQVSKACDESATLVEDIRRAVLFRPYLIEEKVFRAAVEKIEEESDDPVYRAFYQFVFGSQENEPSDP